MANDQPPPPSQPPADEDEFAAIPDPPARRSPVTALVVIALGALVVWHLHADIRYAFRDRTPQALGDARTLAGRGVALEDNIYIEVSGQPDRRNALFIEPRGEKSRQSFFRLLGTGTRLLVRASDTANQPQIADRWVGRLRRFDTLPYAAAMRDYYAREVKAQRFLAPEVLRAALGSPPSTSPATREVRDRTGEALSLSPGTALSIDTANPDYVEVLLSREKFAAEADARHEVERLGFVVHPGYGNAESFGVAIEAPAAKRNAILAKLDEAELSFQASQVRLETRFDQLRAGDGLTLATAEVVRPDGVKVPAVPAPMQIPWAQVKAASVAEPILIAPDAYVVAEAESPAAFWWAPAVAALLLAFVAFNVWYLLRRRDSRPRQPAA